MANFIQMQEMYYLQVCTISYKEKGNRLFFVQGALEWGQETERGYKFGKKRQILWQITRIDG
jgi:hypothetical protein